MRYIKVKGSNPVQIVAAGNVSEGGLGSFDIDIFEEIEGELPSGWIKYEELPTLTGTQLFEELLSAIRENWPSSGKSVSVFISELKEIFTTLKDSQLLSISANEINTSELNALKNVYAADLINSTNINNSALQTINTKLTEKLANYKLKD